MYLSCHFFSPFLESETRIKWVSEEALAECIMNRLTVTCSPIPSIHCIHGQICYLKSICFLLFYVYCNHNNINNWTILTGLHYSFLWFLFFMSPPRASMGLKCVWGFQEYAQDNMFKITIQAAMSQSSSSHYLRLKLMLIWCYMG